MAASAGAISPSRTAMRTPSMKWSLWVLTNTWTPAPAARTDSSAKRVCLRGWRCASGFSIRQSEPRGDSRANTTGSTYDSPDPTFVARWRRVATSPGRSKTKPAMTASAASTDSS